MRAGSLDTPSLRARLAAVLDPVDSWSPERRAGRSDYDLNPDATRRPPGELRPAAVLVPVVDRPGGATVVLTRRADELTSHAGQVAFPGGRIEPGETALEAALREAWEELGLESRLVEPLGLCDPYETVTGFLVTPVVGWIAAPATLRPQPGEVAEIFEPPFAFLLDRANHREEHYDAPDGRRRRFWAMPWEGRYIWGATAGMLRALSQRLDGPDEAAA
jgi:8-oxo-dGTP pyrophosphatase MutT (NUDIX family)